MGRDVCGEVGALESYGKRPWRGEDMQHGDIWHGQLGGRHPGGTLGGLWWRGWSR